MQTLQKISLLIILFFSLSTYATEAEIQELKRQKNFYEASSFSLLSVTGILWITSAAAYFSPKPEMHNSTLSTIFFIGSSAPLTLWTFTQFKKQAIENELDAFEHKKKSKDPKAKRLFDLSPLPLLDQSPVPDPLPSDQRDQISRILEIEKARLSPRISTTEDEFFEIDLQIEVPRNLFLKQIKLNLATISLSP